MNIIYTEIGNVYDIKLKIFEPEQSAKGCILAVHGLCGDMESSAVYALAERMTVHGLTVVTFNFPGHGTSEADSYFCLTNCRRDMLEVMGFAMQKYGSLHAVFATSFGGYVTLLNLDDIPKTAKIILRAPAVNMKLSFESFIADINEFRKKGSHTMGFDRRLDVPYSFYQELEHNYILKTNFERQMLIIHGDCDEIVLPEDMKIFRSHNPLSELKVIEGADHRFKRPNELDKIIKIAEKYIMEE